MSKRFEIGARCAIVISEHYENQNRVVLISDGPFRTKKAKQILWVVTATDGELFRGYDNAITNDEERRKAPKVWASPLGIEQWKLRLLDDDDEVIIRDEMEYVKERA